MINSRIPEPNTILDTGLGNGLPYLGSPSVVNGIIRQYIKDLTDLRSKAVESGDDLSDQVADLANKMQDVFYGHDRNYLSSAWHKESSLGQSLVDGSWVGGETHDAAFRACLRMAKEYLTDLISFEDDRISEAQMKASVDDIIARYTAIFTGGV